MSDALSGYYKQARLEEKARNLLNMYSSAEGEEKRELEKRIELNFRRTPSELQSYLDAWS